MIDASHWLKILILFVSEAVIFEPGIIREGSETNPASITKGLLRINVNLVCLFFFPLKINITKVAVSGCASFAFECNDLGWILIIQS